MDPVQVEQWSTFAESAPELAAHCATRLESGLSYLSTVRPDGWPRTHPVGLHVRSGRLVVPMAPRSPKGGDLRRDGRFAAHCTVEDSNGGGGEVLVTGRAREIEPDDDHRARGWIAFELLPGEVQSVRTVDGARVVERWGPAAN